MLLINVLIVDDMEGIRKKFMRVLGKHPNMNPSVATNGYEAVMKVSEEQPDVILMDIEMETPLAGLMACNTICRSHPEIKIIILTVHEEDNFIFKAFQAGVVSYLLKTSPDKVIIDTIEDAYAGRTSLQPNIARKLCHEFKRLKDNESSLIYLLNIIVQLTPTEIEILKLLNAGFSQKKIADMRYVELSTVKTHINHILKKFGKKRTSQVLKTIQQVDLFSLLR
jgi:DNA-binding NarL/FixJ family response regulator